MKRTIRAKSRHQAINESNFSGLKLRPVGIAVRASLFGFGLACGAANAADIVVTSPLDNDGNGCTLREAIVSANKAIDQNNGCAVGSDSGVDRIVFDSSAFLPNKTIALSAGELNPVDKNIQITAESIGGLTIVASKFARVMRVSRGSVSLNNITLTGGRLIPETADENRSRQSGGGLFLDNSTTVRLTDSHVTDNICDRKGGGISINDNSSLTLVNSTVTNNRAESRGNVLGGGIYASSSNTIELINSEISLNTVSSPSARFGGGVYAKSDNTLVINNSAIIDNLGAGLSLGMRNRLDLVDSRVEGNGANVGDQVDGTSGLEVGNESVVTILRSSVSNNVRGKTYGGLAILGSSATILDSTISGNRSTGVSGAGFSIKNSTVDFENSTISGNVLYSPPISKFGDRRLFLGAVGAITSNSVVSFNNVTISDNVMNPAGPTTTIFPGLLITSSSVTFNNSIVANLQNLYQPDINSNCDFEEFPPPYNSTITIDSATIIEGGGCNAIRTEDPGLLPLADNGGPTLTHALGPNSIALNSGDTSTCLATDQRGLARDANCDVGAFEFGLAVQFLSLTVAPLSIAENGGTSTGTITRDAALDEPLTIMLQSSDLNSATVPTTVLIPAGAASANFAISAVDDLIADGDSVSNITASSTGFADVFATINITDNETPELSLSLPSDTVAEGSGGLTATLSRNTPTTEALTVTLASSLADKVSVPTTVVIPAGQTSTMFELNVIDDDIASGDSLSSITASASGFVDASAPLTITDNDVPALSINLPNNTVAEGSGVLTATLSRNTPSTEALTVTLSSSIEDSVSVPTAVVIPAGQITTEFELNVLDDNIASGNSLSAITASSSGFVDASALLTITDNDVPALILNLPSDTVAEDGGVLTATLSRNTPSTEALTVTLSSSVEDSVSVPTAVVIPAGQASAVFELNVIDDDIVDGDSLSTITASSIGFVDASAPLTITDNDVPALTLNLPSDPVAEGSSGLTATLSHNTSTAEALAVTLSNSLADSVSVPATVTIPAGQITTEFELNVIDDDIANGDRSVTITASRADFASSTAALTVVDDETPQLNISFNQTALLEGESVLGAVSRNTPTDDALTVTLVSNNPLRVTIPATLEIAAGATSATFEVLSVDNSNIDAAERIIITASDASGGLNSGNAEFTLADNDDNDTDGIANNVDNCPAIENADQANLDGDNQGDACDSDIDGDGMPNQFEQANGLNPRNAADANADNDGDGFTNLQEFRFGSDPNVADTDDNNNGTPDAAEVSEFNVAPILLLLLSDD